MKISLSNFMLRIHVTHACIHVGNLSKGENGTYTTVDKEDDFKRSYVYLIVLQSNRVY